jgi:Cu/Ag efflux pump CusA
MMTLLARVLRLSVEHRFAVLALTFTVALLAYNFTAANRRVPDITNVRVQINAI